MYATVSGSFLSLVVIRSAYRWCISHSFPTCDMYVPCYSDDKACMIEFMITRSVCVNINITKHASSIG